MSLSTLRKIVGGSQVSRQPLRRPSRRPGVEALEDRRMLSATLVVGGANDPAAQYHTINAAVTAANPGDTIRVDAGTYHESVNVTKTLTFVANHRRGDVIVDPG